MEPIISRLAAIGKGVAGSTRRPDSVTPGPESLGVDTTALAVARCIPVVSKSHKTALSGMSLSG
ncbi:MAG: hypothetical protein EOO38_23665 [Cytophagaceae bacterium]|nr:MAG: hypothetical protein EOO38_23665 [Cytophagaceae bacterium]